MSQTPLEKASSADTADTPERSALPGSVQDSQAVIAVLRSWCEDDVAEQRETWEFLRQALYERRLPDSKLFP